MRTRVGYAGGTTKDPTYRRIGDHTEVFQVDFDPGVISFAQLLEVFWDVHAPCSGQWSTQYKAILFHHDDAQKQVAETSRKRLQERLGKPITTELKRLDRFYVAEDYHQKYGLRRNRILTADLMAIYKSEKAFADSTAATKVNAHLAGHLSYAELRDELAALGLRAVGARRLERIERAE